MNKSLSGIHLSRRLKEKEDLLSLDNLKNDLLYNNETGIFTRNCVMTGSSIGAVCGSLKPSGYVVISIKTKLYRAHRLAWFYCHGRWPNGDVDHINGNRSDNRIENLRESSRSENLCNSRVRKDNTSGARGVHFNRVNKNYSVIVLMAGVVFSKHGIKTFNEAECLANEKRLSMHGEFVRL